MKTSRQEAPTMTAEQILECALDLPDDQRVMIAQRLFQSVDPETLDKETLDEDVSEAWRVEIQRRLDRYLSGEVTGRPWEEVSQDIKTALLNRKN